MFGNKGYITNKDTNWTLSTFSKFPTYFTKELLGGNNEDNHLKSNVYLIGFRVNYQRRTESLDKKHGQA